MVLKVLLKQRWRWSRNGCKSAVWVVVEMVGESPQMFLGGDESGARCGLVVSRTASDSQRADTAAGGQSNPPAITIKISQLDQSWKRTYKAVKNSFHLLPNNSTCANNPDQNIPISLAKQTYILQILEKLREKVKWSVHRHHRHRPGLLFRHPCPVATHPFFKINITHVRGIGKMR